MPTQDNSTAGAIRRLESLAQEHEQIARDTRAHAEALRRILGGDVLPAPAASRKPKKQISKATRDKLRAKALESWRKRKVAAA